jgi:thiamine kinase-like enzyme
MIDAVVSKLDYKIQNVREIKHSGAIYKSYYILETDDNKKLFLKFRREPKTIVRRFLRIILGNPTFSRQIEVYKLFTKIPISHFNSPKLLSTNGKNYFILEYVDFIDRNVDINKYKSKIIDGLLELQSSLDNNSIANNKINQKILNIFLSFEYSFVTRYSWYIYRTRGVSDLIKIAIIIVKSHLKQKKLSYKILIHNDFHHNNLIVDRGGNLYITDFEGVLIEDKWTLFDIATIALNTHIFKIDYEMINKYLVLFFKKYHIDNAYKVNIQIRIAFIRRLIQLIYSPAPPIDVKRKYENILYTIVINDSEYEKWYKNNFDNFNK